MKKNVIALVAASSLAALCAFGAAAQDTGKTKERAKDTAKETAKDTGKQADRGGKAKAEIGKPAPNFTLPTTDGKEWSLSDAAGKVVVLQWVNPQCPVCVRVMEDGTVASALKELSSMGVVYVAVNSSAAVPASLDGTGNYLATHKVGIPAVLDRDGAVGMMYDARTTPHIFVIDDKGVLRYSGAIDDGNPGNKGSMNYAVNAVKQIKAGETVAPESTRPYGCSVKYKKS